MDTSTDSTLNSNPTKPESGLMARRSEQKRFFGFAVRVVESGNSDPFSDTKISVNIWRRAADDDTRAPQPTELIFH